MSSNTVMTTGSLRDKTAIVTGASSGIGLAVVEKLALCGASVCACVHTINDDVKTEMERIARECNVEIIVLQLDLLKEESIKEVVHNIANKYPSVDILANVAGTVGENSLFMMTKIEEMRKVMEVNFFGPILLTQLVSRLMSRRRCGSIVNFASITAIDGDPAQLEYSASKAAIIVATKKLSSELGRFGIRVNAVAPGLTDTKMLNDMDHDIEQRLLSRMAIKRRAKPGEIADVVAFLASDASSYVTGQVIRVDGGLGV